MPDRALVTEVTQIGVEAASGTAVAANKLLQATKIEIRPETEIDVYGPQGQKYDSVTILNKEWTVGDISGKPNYTEIVYLLSSILGTPTITTPDALNAPSVRLWTWTPSSTAADTPKTLTVEQGPSGGTGERAAYGLVRELAMTFSRNGGNDLTGSMIAQRHEMDVTMTAAPTAVALQPIAPGHVNVYMDNTSGALGTTKLLRDFVAEWSLGDRYNPVYPLNQALNSFDGHVETKPNPTLDLTLGNDAAGRGLVTTMRAGSTKFIRVEAIGPTVETLGYRLRIDMAAQVVQAPTREDVDGLSTLGWGLRMMHDATWGKAFTVELRTTLTAL